MHYDTPRKLTIECHKLLKLQIVIVAICGVITVRKAPFFFISYTSIIYKESKTSNKPRQLLMMLSMTIKLVDPLFETSKLPLIQQTLAFAPTLQFGHLPLILCQF